VAWLDKTFEGVPAIIVSGGPSLDKNAHLLKQAKGKAVLIGMNQTAKVFDAVGVPADFYLTVDGNDLTPHYKKAAAEMLTNLVFRISVFPGMFDLPAERFFLYSGGIKHEDWLFGQIGRGGSIHSGGSVAHDCFSIAVGMGCDPIILIGQDLACTGDKMYSDKVGDSDSTVEYDPESNAYIHHLTGNKKRIHAAVDGTKERVWEVPGYHGEPVRTIESMYIFLQWFNRVMPTLEDRTVINATEGGAKIEGTRQLTFAEAIEKYCTEEVDVEARLQETLKEFDGTVYLEGMQENFERLDEQFDVVRRVAKKCRLRIEKAASLEPEAVNKLHSAQRGLFRAIKPVYDALMSAASGSFKHAIELQGQAQVLEEQLVASERLVEGILTAIDELHPSVKLAIENLKAETERVEAERVAADG